MAGHVANSTLGALLASKMLRLKQVLWDQSLVFAEHVHSEEMTVEFLESTLHTLQGIKMILATTFIGKPPPKPPMLKPYDKLSALKTLIEMRDRASIKTRSKRDSVEDQGITRLGYYTERSREDEKMQEDEEFVDLSKYKKMPIKQLRTSVRERDNNKPKTRERNSLAVTNSLFDQTLPKGGPGLITNSPKSAHQKNLAHTTEYRKKRKRESILSELTEGTSKNLDFRKSTMPAVCHSTAYTPRGKTSSRAVPSVNYFLGLKRPSRQQGVIPSKLVQSLNPSLDISKRRDLKVMLFGGDRKYKG